MLKRREAAKALAGVEALQGTGLSRKGALKMEGATEMVEQPVRRVRKKGQQEARSKAATQKRGEPD